MPQSKVSLTVTQEIQVSCDTESPSLRATLSRVHCDTQLPRWTHRQRIIRTLWTIREPLELYSILKKEKGMCLMLLNS